MTIEHEYLGDPPLLYCAWSGTVAGADLLNHQTAVMADPLARRTARDLYDLRAVTSLDVPQPELRRNVRNLELRRPEPSWTLLICVLVSDTNMLPFAREFQRLVTDVTQDRLQIISEEAAALAYLGRRETSLGDFFKAARAQD